MENKESVQKLVWGTGSLAALFGLWYVLSCTASFGRLMSSPVEVIQSIGQGLVTPIGRQALGQHILWSLSRVMVGYVTATVCGVLLGFCASRLKVGEAIIKPFYLLLRSTPSIAWIPLAILWLGIGERSKYFIIFITTVMIIMTDVMDGVKAVDLDLLGVAEMLGTKENQLFIHIAFPSAVPQIFNGLQVALGSAWATVLAAEMVRSSEGVGWITLAGQSPMNMVQIFAGIVMVGLIGLFLASVTRFAESKLCAWNVRRKQMGTFIEAKNLAKTFHQTKEEEGNQALKDVNFSMDENESIVVFRPGQCGKTTLLNIIAGLEKVSSGGVYIRGKKAEKLGPDRAMVFQNILLFLWLTVTGNVEYSTKVRGADKKERRAEAQKYVDLVGLNGFETVYPVRISGGMKQRVGIARAYCTEPNVMPMDEPFGALGAQTRYLMQDEAIRIRNMEKRTVIFVTNNIEEALHLADRIIVMTTCPSTISADIRIQLPRPRNYVDLKFLKLRKEISAMVNRKR